MLGDMFLQTSDEETIQVKYQYKYLGLEPSSSADLSPMPPDFDLTPHPGGLLDERPNY